MGFVGKRHEDDFRVVSRGRQGGVMRTLLGHMSLEEKRGNTASAPRRACSWYQVKPD